MCDAGFGTTMSRVVSTRKYDARPPVMQAGVTHPRSLDCTRRVWTQMDWKSVQRVMVTTCLLIVAGCGENRPQKMEFPSKPANEQPAEATVREVRVAAASDLKFALDDVIQAYEKVHPGTRISATYGSSGNFFAQLSNKAPFDVFLSADVDYPRKLIEAGHGVKETEFTYAVGRIVVWVRNESPLDLEKEGIEALKDESVKKVSIANPKHAPYGRAAEASLKTLGVYDTVEPRLVFGENISQTAQFIESGAADAGIIAMSLAVAPAMRQKGRFWEVPLDAYPKMLQGGVVLPWAQDDKAAKELCEFITGEEGKTILKGYGFWMPED